MDNYTYKFILILHQFLVKRKTDYEQMENEFSEFSVTIIMVKILNP